MEKSIIEASVTGGRMNGARAFLDEAPLQLVMQDVALTMREIPMRLSRDMNVRLLYPAPPFVVQDIHS